MTTIYDTIKTETLLKAVQRTALLMREKDFKKKNTQTKIQKIDHDLKEIRAALIPRLRKMDRNDPKFFPQGSYVQYTRRISSEEFANFDLIPEERIKYGIVAGHHDSHVLVQFEGEGYFVRVDPPDLLLRFIR